MPLTKNNIYQVIHYYLKSLFTNSKSFKAPKRLVYLRKTFIYTTITTNNPTKLSLHQLSSSVTGVRFVCLILVDIVSLFRCNNTFRIIFGRGRTKLISNNYQIYILSNDRCSHIRKIEYKIRNNEIENIIICYVIDIWIYRRYI